MERGKNHDRVSGSRNRLKIALIIVIAVIVLSFVGFIIWDYSQDSICVTRSISDRTVTLDINTGLFNKPKSFIIEERLPSGGFLSSSNLKPLTEGVNGISWLFWSGGEGLKVRDTEIVYSYENASSGEPVGKITLAINKRNIEEGYTEEVLKIGSTCIK